MRLKRFAAFATLLTSLVPQSSPASSLPKTQFSERLCKESTCEQQTHPLLWFTSEPQARAVWAPFGTKHAGAEPFASWVNKAKDARARPAFKSTLSLNCWEYVLYTALRLEHLTLEEVKDLYAKRTAGDKLSEFIGTPVGTAHYKVRGAKVKLTWPDGLSSGDIVFMDETSHVVQLLGEANAQGEQLVISFSPRPIWGDGSHERPVENTRPELTTVESLIEQMIELYPDVPTDWNNINLKIIRPTKKEKP